MNISQNPSILFQYIDLLQADFQNYMPSVISLTILLITLSLFGSLANIIVILIFNINTTHGISNTSIKVLACIDLIICSVDIPATLLWIIWKLPSNDALCKIHMTIKATIIPASVFVLVLIAVDRFLIICFIPSKVIKKKYGAYILISIFIGSLGLALPFGMAFGVRTGEIKLDDVDILLSNISNSSMIMEQGYRYPNATAHYNPLSFYIMPKTCEMDNLFTSKESIERYQLMIFALFSILMTAIIIFYFFIFIYVWAKQKRFVTKYTNNSLISFQKPQSQYMPMRSQLECSTQQVEFYENHSRKKVTYSSHPQRRNRAHVKTGQILIFITSTFIISYLPYFLIINNLLWPISAPPDSQSTTISWKLQIRRLLIYFYYLNSISNPIIYSCMSKQLRCSIKHFLNIK